MTSYVPPLRDMWFVIDQVLHLPRAWARMPAFADIDADIARQVLEEAGRFTTDILAPTNSPGDLEGCHFTNGEVTTPQGYKEAYRAYVEGGWPALACDPEAGGQGLPNALNAVLLEMTAAANHAWSMYAGLLHGAYACLHAFASPELKERYLGKVVSGEWAGTMCLTEPQAGSDLGLLRSRAEPRGDGSYAISGNKIFISGGEHDLTDNIVHLVLARLPDAPAGTRGISLFLVPKLLPEELGGGRNAAYCDGIEKKMGIKGSATCAMRFEDAQGWLVGEANRGLQAMFVMMNAARIQVALQGLAHADAAHGRALRYALERQQSRAPVREQAERPADPLTAHPAMRRTLLDQRCVVEGGRVLAYWGAHLLDTAEGAPDAGDREQAENHLALLTPILKAYLTDAGFQVASQALQVFGGYGYVHEYEVEQTLRDSRIALIYEGTNEIQAIDLLVRKIVSDGGRRFGALLDVVAADAREAGASAHGPALAALVDTVRGVTGEICASAADDAEYPFRVADDFLRLAALTFMAHAWLRLDRAASGEAREAADFLAAKREAAGHFFRYNLPEAELHVARIRAGRENLPAVALIA
ncbi:MAG: acyl-CoA dehydrogenase family protein [Pigmentiphaga sp.]|nr:acyl-CoA dehydrogenase family protein [Pigmentiphaga sp.]